MSAIHLSRKEATRGLKTSAALVVAPRLAPCRQSRARRPCRVVQAALGAEASTLTAAFLAYASPVCFSQACQEATDRAFLIALSIPLLVGAAAGAYLLRPPPKELEESGRIFEDPVTGTRFEAPEGVKPERDKNGELAFRPISYTPWPVDESYEGERVRIAVGPVNNRQLRTYVFNRLIPSLPSGDPGSDILLVTLPRPLGVVLEWDERRKRAVVVDLVEGTAAEQRSRIASINTSLKAEAVLPGDLLRAVTATNFVYPTKALFGASAPERHIVVYGADKQGWAGLCAALKRGEAKDGDVTLVLERRRIREAKEGLQGGAVDIFA